MSIDDIKSSNNMLAGGISLINLTYNKLKTTLLTFQLNKPSYMNSTIERFEFILKYLLKT